MNKYKVKIEIELSVTADNRDDAMKIARRWEGESSSFIGSLGGLDWNYSKKIKSAKKVKTVEEKYKEEDVKKGNYFIYDFNNESNWKY